MRSSTPYVRPVLSSVNDGRAAAYSKPHISLETRRYCGTSSPFCLVFVVCLKLILLVFCFSFIIGRVPAHLPKIGRAAICNEKCAI